MSLARLSDVSFAGIFRTGGSVFEGPDTRPGIVVHSFNGQIPGLGHFLVLPTAYEDEEFLFAWSYRFFSHDPYLDPKILMFMDLE